MLQAVVPDPVEGPLYVQEDGKSVLLQIGMSGGVRVKLKDGVDGGAFRPESELLRWEETCYSAWLHQMITHLKQQENMQDCTLNDVIQMLRYANGNLELEVTNFRPRGDSENLSRLESSDIYRYSGYRVSDYCVPTNSE
ncbi:hypothetical protein GEV33_004159 [Tenebrio molitor]|uniref:Uncharacterized protein n=1 Tax=Tenebrio molitor TaxID=7067 RepID=A0A8J6LGF3_TENMO|nr:hypothetical protein GEV33_004159 [Tenebrio molitor]